MNILNVNWDDPRWDLFWDCGDRVKQDRMMLEFIVAWFKFWFLWE